MTSKSQQPGAPVEDMRKEKTKTRNQKYGDWALLARWWLIRAALAGVCARLATRRITDAQKKKLVGLCEKMEKDKPGTDLKAMLRQNFEFHDIIFKAAHAPSIEGLALQYYHQSEQFRALSLELPGRFEEVWREHRSILQAILDGDAEAAERSSRDHQLNTARRIVRSLGYEGEI